MEKGDSDGNGATGLVKKEIRGIQINYEVSGAGAPLLFLHGWGGCINSFLPVIQEMSKYRTVYALDFPGFGQSETPKEPMGVPEYTEVTAAFIREMGIEGADIINHSFGGRVSILLAAQYPELVGKIIFTDAAGVRPRRTIKYYCKVLFFKLCKKAAKNRAATALFRFFGVDVQKRVKNSGSADYRALKSEVMRATFVRVVNQDLTPYLSKIKAPSLLVYGRQDEDTPLKVAKIMEKKIPDAGLVVLENAGHFSYLDQYAQYIKIVKVFLGEN